MAAAHHDDEEMAYVPLQAGSDVARPARARGVLRSEYLAYRDRPGDACSRTSGQMVSWLRCTIGMAARRGVGRGSGRQSRRTAGPVPRRRSGVCSARRDQQDGDHAPASYVEASGDAPLYVYIHGTAVRPQDPGSGFTGAIGRRTAMTESSAAHRPTIRGRRARRESEVSALRCHGRDARSISGAEPRRRSEADRVRCVRPFHRTTPEHAMGRYVHRSSSGRQWPCGAPDSARREKSPRTDGFCVFRCLG